MLIQTPEQKREELNLLYKEKLNNINNVPAEVIAKLKNDFVKSGVFAQTGMYVFIVEKHEAVMQGKKVIEVIPVIGESAQIRKYSTGDLSRTEAGVEFKTIEDGAILRELDRQGWKVIGTLHDPTKEKLVLNDDAKSILDQVASKPKK